uniref:VWFA domain-containing protein n=1 Tax=Naja naja TaxID=35670 RepID=A0A8C7E435_NAJNA
PNGKTPICECFCREASVADIVFMVDGSWSIGPKNFRIIQDFLYTLVNSFDIGKDKIQVGMIQYSDDPRNEFLLNFFHQKKDILKKIQNLNYKGGGTKTGKSLRFMLDEQFSEMAGSRHSEGIPQIAVVITDGQSQDNFSGPAEEVKNAGIILYAIGIKDAILSELQEIASDPDEMHVYDVEDFVDDIEDLDQVQKIIVDIVEVPVQQEYEAVLDANVPADIVFLVDESTRIGQKNFQLIRTFLLKIINALEIAPDNVRVALVLYSDEPRLEFSLNTFEDKSEVMNYLKRLPYRGGQTYMGAAIDFLKKKVFTKTAGSRKNHGVQQLAAVITDGQSLDDFTVPSSKLRRAGVTVYVIGIQNISASSQLYKIASHPPRKHVTTMEYFLQLSNLEYVIKKQLCSEIVSQTFAIPVQSRALKEGKRVIS